MALIGEAPGADEDKSGKPFSGGAGRVLGRVLYDAGIQRHQVYITNVVKHRPPNNDLSVCDHTKEFGNLTSELNSLPNARVIVPLGNYALSFFGLWGISSWRGSPFWWEGKRVIPTIHPAYLMRDRRMFPCVVHDLKRAWDCAIRVNVLWQEPERHYIPHPSVHEATEYVKAMRGFVVVDIETLEDFNTVTHVGIGDRKHSGMSIPSDEDFIRPLMALTRRQGDHVMQNGPFDMSRLEDTFGSRPICTFDTMLAHHLICNALPHDLGFLNSIYGDLPYWKRERKQDTATYNCKDLDATYQAMEGSRVDLARYGMVELFGVVMQAQRVVYDMDRRGITFDLIKCAQVAKEYDERCVVLENMLKESAKETWFNPLSPKDVQKLLFDTLGLPKLYKRGSLKLTTEDDQLIKHKHVPEVKWLLEYRHKRKMRSTYIPDDPEVIDGTSLGISYFSTKMHGTHTGRYSSGLHTYPPEMRRVVVARPGYTLGYLDLSQVEFRVAIHDSGDKAGKRLLDSGGDIHRGCAAVGFRKREDEVTPTERFMAKFVVHGSRYGRGPSSVAEQFGITVADAEAIQDQILGAFPEAEEWRRGEAEHAAKHGYNINSFARRRYYLDDLPNEIERMAFNFRPQSEAHDILMRASIVVRTRFPECHIIADMHDALLVELPSSDAEELVKQIKEVMEAEYMPGLAVPVKYVLGSNWGDLDDRLTEEKWV